MVIGGRTSVAMVVRLRIEETNVLLRRRVLRHGGELGDKRSISKVQCAARATRKECVRRLKVSIEKKIAR